MVKGTDENVDELRQRLDQMKKLMAERKMMQEGNDNKDRSCGFIDGSLLGFVFGTALVVILGVSVYAFYNLFSAVVKKFGARHEEL